MEAKDYAQRALSIAAYIVREGDSLTPHHLAIEYTELLEAATAAVDQNRFETIRATKVKV